MQIDKNLALLVIFGCEGGLSSARRAARQAEELSGMPQLKFDV
jgi:hypothetical protein